MHRTPFALVLYTNDLTRPTIEKIFNLLSGISFLWCLYLFLVGFQSDGHRQRWLKNASISLSRDTSQIINCDFDLRTHLLFFLQGITLLLATSGKSIGWNRCSPFALKQSGLRLDHAIIWLVADCEFEEHHERFLQATVILHENQNGKKVPSKRNTQLYKIN